MENKIKTKKKIIILLSLLLVLMLLLCITIFTKEKDSNNDDNTNNKIQNEEFYNTVEDVFMIETPYCSLYFPKEWESDVYLKTSEGNNTYTVMFYTSVNTNELHLFDVSFNEPKGTLIGYLEKDAESVEVYLANYDNDFSMYTLEQQNDLYDIMEGVNTIIAKLIEHYSLKLL